MNFDDRLFKFPQKMDNDLEKYLFLYPIKFPGIVAYYEKIAREIGTDAKAFRQYGNWARDELWAGFEKIQKDYDAGDQNNLEFLVKTDERLHKLFCWRFWPVNYLFPDSLLHDYYADSVKQLSRKMIDPMEDVEEFETRVREVERDLLQGDYADLYLQQALGGYNTIKLLRDDPEAILIIEKASSLIKDGVKKNLENINTLWGELIERIESGKCRNNEEIRTLMNVPFQQAKRLKSLSPINNALTHALEFESENAHLFERDTMIKSRLKNILVRASEKLSPEEYELLVLSYDQLRNFTEFKDIIGDIDRVLLPLWLGMRPKISALLGIPEESKIPAMNGPSALFWGFIWYLPANLKDKIFTPDDTPFSLDTL